MSVDVDAVNERLNGLVTLLQAVGVDSNDVAQVSNKIGSNGGGRAGAPDARQLNDDQIEAIIRKLQLAQEEAPQIIAALEAHAESRSVNGGNKQQTQQRQQQQQPEPEEEEEEEDDDEDDDEANYPMVGHGVSDDISVVSDLTTPTVLVGVPVPEEEHYRDSLPPMIVGGGPGNAPPMVVNPSKRKNLVSQVRPTGMSGPRRNLPTPRSNSGASGGAAAKRRNNYNSTMAKMGEHPQRQSSKPHHPQHSSSKSRSSKSSPNSSASGERRVKKKKPREPTSRPPHHQQQHHHDSEFTNFNASSTSSKNRWESPHNRNAFQNSQSSSNDWNAFDSTPQSPSKAAAPTVIDNDGFLVGDSFDPFAATASNPFNTPSSSAGDLAFRGGNRRAPHSSGSSSNGDRPRRPKSGSGGSSKSRPNPAALQQPLRPKPQGAASGGRPRRSRRASLAM